MMGSGSFPKRQFEVLGLKALQPHQAHPLRSLRTLKLDATPGRAWTPKLLR